MRSSSPSPAGASDRGSDRKPASLVERWMDRKPSSPWDRASDGAPSRADDPSRRSGPGAKGCGKRTTTATRTRFAGAWLPYWTVRRVARQYSDVM